MRILRNYLLDQAIPLVERYTKRQQRRMHYASLRVLQAKGLERAHARRVKHRIEQRYQDAHNLCLHLYFKRWID